MDKKLESTTNHLMSGEEKDKKEQMHRHERTIYRIIILVLTCLLLYNDILQQSRTSKATNQSSILPQEIDVEAIGKGRIVDSVGESNVINGDTKTLQSYPSETEIEVNTDTVASEDTKYDISLDDNKKEIKLKNKDENDENEYQNVDSPALQDSNKKDTDEKEILGYPNDQENTLPKNKEIGKFDETITISNEKNDESIKTTESFSSSENIQHDKEIPTIDNNHDTESSSRINYNIENEQKLTNENSISSIDKGDGNENDGNKMFEDNNSNDSNSDQSSQNLNSAHFNMGKEDRIVVDEEVKDEVNNYLTNETTSQSNIDNIIQLDKSPDEEDNMNIYEDHVTDQTKKSGSDPVYNDILPNKDTFVSNTEMEQIIQNKDGNVHISDLEESSNHFDGDIDEEKDSTSFTLMENEKETDAEENIVTTSDISHPHEESHQNEMTSNDGDRNILNENVAANNVEQISESDEDTGVYEDETKKSKREQELGANTTDTTSKDDFETHTPSYATDDTQNEELETRFSEKEHTSVPQTDNRELNDDISGNEVNIKQDSVIDDHDETLVSNNSFNELNLAIDEDEVERNKITHDEITNNDLLQKLDMQMKYDTDEERDDIPPTNPNKIFISGLEDLGNFLEEVDPPDELDVGADGTSMQDLLVGKGAKILMKKLSAGVNVVKNNVGKVIGKIHHSDKESDDIENHGAVNITSTPNNAVHNNTRDVSFFDPSKLVRSAQALWKKIRITSLKIRDLIAEIIFDDDDDDDDIEDIYDVDFLTENEDMRNFFSMKGLTSVEDDEISDLKLKLMKNRQDEALSTRKQKDLIEKESNRVNTKTSYIKKLESIRKSKDPSLSEKDHDFGFLKGVTQPIKKNKDDLVKDQNKEDSVTDQNNIEEDINESFTLEEKQSTSEVEQPELTQEKETSLSDFQNGPLELSDDKEPEMNEESNDTNISIANQDLEAIVDDMEGNDLDSENDEEIDVRAEKSLSDNQNAQTGDMKYNITESELAERDIEMVEENATSNFSFDKTDVSSENVDMEKDFNSVQDNDAVDILDIDKKEQVSNNDTTVLSTETNLSNNTLDIESNAIPDLQQIENEDLLGVKDNFDESHEKSSGYVESEIDENEKSSTTHDENPSDRVERNEHQSKTLLNNISADEVAMDMMEENENDSVKKVPTQDKITDSDDVIEMNNEITDGNDENDLSLLKKNSGDEINQDRHENEIENDSVTKMSSQDKIIKSNDLADMNIEITDGNDENNLLSSEKNSDNNISEDSRETRQKMTSIPEHDDEMESMEEVSDTDSMRTSVPPIDQNNEENENIVVSQKKKDIILSDNEDFFDFDEIVEEIPIVTGSDDKKSQDSLISNNDEIIEKNMTVGNVLKEDEYTSVDNPGVSTDMTPETINDDNSIDDRDEKLNASSNIEVNNSIISDDESEENQDQSTQVNDEVQNEHHDEHKYSDLSNHQFHDDMIVDLNDEKEESTIMMERQAEENDDSSNALGNTNNFEISRMETDANDIQEEPIKLEKDILNDQISENIISGEDTSLPTSDIDPTKNVNEFDEVQSKGAVDDIALTKDQEIVIEESVQDVMNSMIVDEFDTSDVGAQKDMNVREMEVDRISRDDSIVLEEDDTISSSIIDMDANNDFVFGLDDIEKFMEHVDVPDELDPSAAGTSLQEVLIGQGGQILAKRIRMGANAVKNGFEKVANRVKKGNKDGNSIENNNRNKQSNRNKDKFKIQKPNFKEATKAVWNFISDESDDDEDIFSDNLEMKNFFEEKRISNPFLDENKIDGFEIDDIRKNAFKKVTGSSKQSNAGSKADSLFP